MGWADGEGKKGRQMGARYESGKWTVVSGQFSGQFSGQLGVKLVDSLVDNLVDGHGGGSKAGWVDREEEERDGRLN